MSNLSGLRARMGITVNALELQYFKGDTDQLLEQRKYLAASQLVSQIMAVTVFEKTKPFIDGSPCVKYSADLFVLSVKQMEDLILSVRRGEFDDEEFS